jgi:hypothetical protein
MSYANKCISIEESLVEINTLVPQELKGIDPQQSLAANATIQINLLLQLSDEILVSAQSNNNSIEIASAGVGAPITNPEEDPHFDTSIPIDKDGKIDMTALLDRLEKYFNFLRCNIMNLSAAKELEQFLLNMGHKWGQIKKDATPAQLDILKKALNETIDGPGLYVFGSLDKDGKPSGDGFYVHSLGELLGYTICLEVFYNQPDGTSEAERIKRTKAFIEGLNNELNGMQDFVNDCDLLKKMQIAVKELFQDGKFTHFELWEKMHWDYRGSPYDDRQVDVTYDRWLIDAQGYLGKFLRSIKDDFGGWDQGGKWEKNYYKSLIDNFIKGLGAHPDPFLVFLYILSIFDKQNEDRQEEIVGASQPGKYLGEASELITHAMQILTKKHWADDPNSADAKDFFQSIEDAKRLIANDADIDPSMAKSFISNLDTFFKQDDATPDPIFHTSHTLEYDFQHGQYQTIDNWFNKNVFDSSTGGKLDLWTKMCSALTENNDTCKEQSSAQGSIVSNMGNTLNQYFAIQKSLRDDYLNQEKAAVKNEITR